MEKLPTPSLWSTNHDPVVRDDEKGERSETSTVVAQPNPTKEVK